MRDRFLAVIEGESASGLPTIEASPNQLSVADPRAFTDEPAAIEETGALAVDPSCLNGNYQDGLLIQVRKCSAHRFREVVMLTLGAGLLPLLARVGHIDRRAQSRARSCGVSDRRAQGMERRRPVSATAVRRLTPAPQAAQAEARWAPCQPQADKRRPIRVSHCGGTMTFSRAHSSPPPRSRRRWCAVRDR